VPDLNEATYHQRLPGFLARLEAPGNPSIRVNEMAWFILGYEMFGAQIPPLVLLADLVERPGLRAPPAGDWNGPTLGDRLRAKGIYPFKFILAQKAQDKFDLVLRASTQWSKGLLIRFGPLLELHSQGSHLDDPTGTIGQEHGFDRDLFGEPQQVGGHGLRRLDGGAILASQGLGDGFGRWQELAQERVGAWNVVKSPAKVPEGAVPAPAATRSCPCYRVNQGPGNRTA